MQLFVKHSIIFRTRSFFFILTLRQGTILIAVHQIALASCLLALLMVGMAHADEVLDLLKADMADDAQREGLHSFNSYKLDDNTMTHHGGVTSTNHEKFILAQSLAKVTVIVLYGSIILTAMYILFCVTLLFGAIKGKKEYVDPWIFIAIATAGILIIVMYMGDTTEMVIETFNGHTVYRILCMFILLGHYYCIIAVASYSAELKQTNNTRIKKSLAEFKLRMHTNCGEKCEGGILKEDNKSVRENNTPTAVIISNHV